MCGGGLEALIRDVGVPCPPEPDPPEPEEGGFLYGDEFGLTVTNIEIKSIDELKEMLFLNENAIKLYYILNKFLS